MLEKNFLHGPSVTVPLVSVAVPSLVCTPLCRIPSVGAANTVCESVTKDRLSWAPAVRQTLRRELSRSSQPWGKQKSMAAAGRNGRQVLATTRTSHPRPRVTVPTLYESRVTVLPTVMGKHFGEESRPDQSHTAGTRERGLEPSSSAPPTPGLLGAGWPPTAPAVSTHLRLSLQERPATPLRPRPPLPRLGLGQHRVSPRETAPDCPTDGPPRGSLSNAPRSFPSRVLSRCRALGVRQSPPASDTRSLSLQTKVSTETTAPVVSQVPRVWRQPGPAPSSAGPRLGASRTGAPGGLTEDGVASKLTCAVGRIHSCKTGGHGPLQSTADGSLSQGLPHMAPHFCKASMRQSLE